MRYHIERASLNDTTGARTPGLLAVRERIAQAEQRYGRKSGNVRLLAVSKKKSAEAIRAVFGNGQRAFGENYVQEAVVKQRELSDVPAEWHFIGPIQSNKTRLVAEHFDWVHSVDRLKVAERLARQRPSALPPLNVLLQVNISGEASKSGAAPDDLGALAEAILVLPRLRLRGLMAVPAPAEEFSAQRGAFSRVRELMEELQRGPGAGSSDIDQLSMGMSADLEAAVAEGAPLKLLCHAERTPEGVRASVAPTPVSRDDPLAQLRGTSSAVAFKMDTLKELVILENDPGPAQTAYGLLADFVNAVRRRA